MTATEQALAHFHRISEAPDVIPRLRQFVLDLAVRGRLVEQDLNDEPMSTVLNHREAAYSFDGRFEVPQSWVWVKVGNVAETRLGKMLDKARNKGIPRRYLRNVNVRWFDFDLSDVAEMRFEDSELKEFALRSGDVLICEGGEPGRAAVWDERESDIYFQKAIHRVRFFSGVDGAYFVKALRASANDGSLAKHFTGTGIKHFTGKGVDAYSFPLPPLAEQHRIVAKVDELMALCDRLETAQKKRERRRDRLVSASLARLSQPVDPPIFREHARFYLDHLPRMTTSRAHIRQLRQAVLDLALHGRLVPQDPKDEPAEALVSRADRERRATAETDRRADAHPQTLLASNDRWEVPSSWVWRGLADLALFIDYRGQTPVKTDQGIRLITAKNVRAGAISFTPEEFISEATYEKWMTRGLPTDGDVLFTTEAPMGNAAVIRLNERFALAQRVICFRSYEALWPDFLELQLLARPFQSILERTATGLTAKGIKAAKLKRLPIVVPPLAEQRRIVAKVDELMAVCDLLEAQLETGRVAQAALLQATLRDALSRSEPALGNGAL